MSLASENANKPTSKGSILYFKFYSVWLQEFDKYVQTTHLLKKPFGYTKFPIGLKTRRIRLIWHRVKLSIYQTEISDTRRTIKEKKYNFEI